MTYKRITQDVFIIQQYTGSQYGWEDVHAEDTRKAARERLKEYRQNQPEYPARLITRREKIESSESIDPLFIGIYPAGIVYADRTQEEHGDFKRLAFLDYGTLTLTVRHTCPADLKTRIEKDAAKIQAQRGQNFSIDSCGSFVVLGG